MNKRGLIIVICVGIGTAIGVATNHLAMWVAIGAGAALALAYGRPCCGVQKEGQ